MKKIIVIFSGLAALLLVAGSILLLVDFDSPEIGKAFMQKVEESTGLQWNAERFRLNLLRGLYLENVNASGKLAGTEMQAQIKKLTVKHRILPLLRRQISASEVVLEDLEVELFQSSRDNRSSAATNKAKRKPSTPDPAPKSSPVETANEKQLGFGVSELRIENALVTVRSNQTRKPLTVIRALSLKLNNLTLQEEAASPLEGLSAKGEVRADEIQIGKTNLRKNEGQIEFAGGELRATELKFENDKGNFEAQLDVNLRSSPVEYELVLKGDPVNTNLVLGGKEDDGYGPTQLDFQGEGYGTNSGDLKGNGNFTLEDGKLPSSPVFVTIERVVGRTDLIGAPYKAGSTTFRIQDNRVHLDRFTLQIDQGSMDLSGWVSLDGPLGLECNVKLPRKIVKVKEIPNEVLDVLTDNDGWIILPFQIRGIPENPVTQLDTEELLAKAGEGTKRILKQKLTDKLKNFLKN